MTPPDSDYRSRVYRGGSWLPQKKAFVRAAYCGSGASYFRSVVYGFRTVQSGCRQAVRST